MKNIIIKFNLLVFIIIFYIYIFLYIIIPIYLKDNPKILYNTIFWICCVYRSVANGVFFAMFVVLGFEFLRGRKINHFPPHKHCHKQCEYHRVTRIFGRQKNSPFPSPQKLSYK